MIEHYVGLNLLKFPASATIRTEAVIFENKWLCSSPLTRCTAFFKKKYREPLQSVRQYFPASLLPQSFDVHAPRDANQIKMNNTTGNVIQGIAHVRRRFSKRRALHTNQIKKIQEKDELAILLNRRRYYCVASSTCRISHQRENDFAALIEMALVDIFHCRLHPSKSARIQFKLICFK